MKRFMLVITSAALILSLSFSQNVINTNLLDEKEGLVYKQNQLNPYTGKVLDLYENGQKKVEGDYENGLMNGIWRHWNKDGNKISEVTFKGGSKDGKWIYWYENGQKREEKAYKDGSLNGFWVGWFENGHKEFEGKFNYGIQDGFWKWWDKDGNKIEFEEMVKEQMSEDKSHVGEPLPTPPAESRVQLIPYDDAPYPIGGPEKIFGNIMYPEFAKKVGMEGTIIVSVFVDKNGFVRETIIMKGIPNSGFDEAAVEAIRKVRFIPAKRAGEAIGVWISIPISFRLEN